MLYKLNPDYSVTPCSPDEHMQLIDNPDYRRLARDEFQGYTVSTTFSGVDLRSVDKPLPAPLLFSVTVFDPDIVILATIALHGRWLWRGTRFASKHYRKY